MFCVCLTSVCYYVVSSTLCVCCLLSVFVYDVCRSLMCWWWVSYVLFFVLEFCFFVFVAFVSGLFFFGFDGLLFGWLLSA